MFIRKKLEILLIATSLAPLLLVGGFYDHSSQRSIRSKVSGFAGELARSNGLYINSRIRNLESSLNTMVANRLLHDLLRDFADRPPLEQVKRSLDTERLLSTVLHLNREVRAIGLFLYPGRLSLYGEESAPAGGEGPPLFYYRLLKEFFGDPSAPGRSSGPRDFAASPQWVTELPPRESRLYLMREIKSFYSPEPMGVLVYIIDAEVIKGVIPQAAGREEGLSFIVDSRGRPIAPAALPVRADFLPLIPEDPPAGVIPYRDELLSYARITNGWFWVSLTPTGKLMEDILFIRMLSFAIAGLCIMLVLLLSFRFSLAVSRRFSRLIAKMGQVEQGSLAIPPPGKERDEIDLLDAHFYRMTRRLSELIDRNYIQTLENQKAELKALQHQVNPHFLFNTLEIINAMALGGETRNIRGVTQRLGDLFRYNMDKEGAGPVPLREEIGHAETYLYLMRLHRNRRVNLFVDIPPELLDRRISKFTLQPLMENSLLHGFGEDRSAGTVEITGRAGSGSWELSVHDDGRGMTPEELKRFARGEALGESAIGLVNVRQRLALAFGPEAGMTLESAPGRGTRVSLIFPDEEAAHVHPSGS